MNKAKLKYYAPQARKDFIAAVTARAHLLGLSEKAGKLEVATSQTQGDVTVIAGQAWPAKVHKQRQQLITRIQKHGFAQTMEVVAYTWFNRFAALRYMELHNYLGHGHRTLSSQEGGLPEILIYAADLAESGELPGLRPELVTEMKLAGTRDGELYRLLLIAQCNSLSNVMPFLFERIDDETELLLPDNLLRTDSVIAKLVAAIDEEDWNEVEIIGWLYQFYISERKDEVIGKVVKSEDIPAATQLFTPNWIVQYLVQNSVGRLWLIANPTSALAGQWPYYIEPALQAPEAKVELKALALSRINQDGGSLNPETITILDPACGSGHILVEAYDLLKGIYSERGYQPRSIPRLILEKNLFGLDIDDRAAQMTGFVLLMKARSDDRRLFEKPINLNILSLQESKGMDVEEIASALRPAAHRIDPEKMRTAVAMESAARDLTCENFSQLTIDSISPDELRDPLRRVISGLVDMFFSAKTYGSLIQIPNAILVHLDWFEEVLDGAEHGGDLYAKIAAQDLRPLVIQARMLAMEFDSVVANPPYMSGKSMEPKLKEFMKAGYQGFEKDLFSAFIIRMLHFTKSSGFIGVMTSFTWMFISSFEKLREVVIRNSTLNSLVQLEYDAFEDAKAHLCTFVLSRSHVEDFSAKFIRLTKFKGAANQGPRTLEAIRSENCDWLYIMKPERFLDIPGMPIAYWLSDFVVSLLASSPSLDKYATPRQGLATGENAIFVRAWTEVSVDRIDFSRTSRSNAAESTARWFPYNKGGERKKWYGNQIFVVDWESGGKKLLAAKPKSVIRNPDTYFLESISWSKVTTGGFCLRYYPAGFIYDVAGCCIFVEDRRNMLSIMGAMNSVVMTGLFSELSPTVNMEVGQVAKFSLPDAVLNTPDDVISSINTLIGLSKSDWDSFETSWDFKSIPFVSLELRTSTLERSWSAWDNFNSARMLQISNLEEHNNKYYIRAYGLQDELCPAVPSSQITLVPADREKDCQRMVSYAIGCMMGRYSLGEPGLIYAKAGNVGFDSSRFPDFPVDADGILPLTDELWFEDDGANRIREFLVAVWGGDTLTENMAWLAESLGAKASETPEEAIRRYLVGKFYKEHLQTYKKRPIYWLFSSGKHGAFQALVYLHRYNEGTLSRIRAEYVAPLTGKIQSRIDMLEKDEAVATSTAARNKFGKEIERLKKKHVELLAYDEQLRHYADMRISLDLDDGVKVNYGKFGDLLAEVKAVTGGASDD